MQCRETLQNLCHIVGLLNINNHTIAGQLLLYTYIYTYTYTYTLITTICRPDERNILHITSKIYYE